MLILTSILNDENKLLLPEILCERWELKTGAILYCTTHSKGILLSKNELNNESVAINICTENIVFLPLDMVNDMELVSNEKLTLAFKGDLVAINIGKTGHIYAGNHLDRLKSQLELSLNKEYQELSKKFTDTTLIENIIMFVKLSDFDESKIEKLLNTPCLLSKLLEDYYFDKKRIIMNAFNKDEYKDFFDKKMAELIEKI